MDINSDVFLQDKGLLLYKSGKFTEAIATWELAAAKGNANSMFGLGITYLTDSCLDEEKARIWFKRAYLAGHSKAVKILKTMDLGRAQIVNDYTSFKIDDFEKNTGVKSNSNHWAGFEVTKFGPYSWLVLDEDGEKRLCVTRDIIDIRRYNEKLVPVSWANCDLRAYLNKQFYQTFTEEQKARFCEVKILNLGNSQYNISPSEPTMDRLFLLSEEEIMHYWKVKSDNVVAVNNASSSNEEPCFRLVAYVNLGKKQLANGFRDYGFDYSGIQKTSLGWWLRTPGKNVCQAMRVNCHGILRNGGRDIDRNLVGVRPAAWIKL